MSRAADQVHAEMLTLLPQGAAWPGRADSVLAAVLRPMAVGIAEVEAAAAATMDEVDPRSATAGLPDFERLLGADPCGRDFGALALGERRRIAHARYTARGGASPDYFRTLAASFGADITVDQQIASQAGRAVAGEELVPETEPFVWVVSALQLGSWAEAEAGETGAGDLLYSFGLSPVECEIRRRKPAHTDVYFFYV